jgi:hypothetical protein
LGCRPFLPKFTEGQSCQKLQDGHKKSAGVTSAFGKKSPDGNPFAIFYLSCLLGSSRCEQRGSLASHSMYRPHCRSALGISRAFPEIFPHTAFGVVRLRGQMRIILVRFEGFLSARLL